MSEPRLTLRAIRARGVEVPLKLPLGTSAGTLRSAALLLIDLDTEEGVTGHSYLFCYLPAAAPAIAVMLGEIERSVKGDRVVPADLWAKLARRFKLIGVQGIVRMAMAGFDCACWDALAIAAGKPLVTLLGGAPCRIRAYNSNGLGLMAPEAAADEGERLLEGGFRAVKLRLGYPTLAADLASLRAVRKRLPNKIEIMVDFNQALSLPEQMAEALEAGACDCVMPDLERIGGVTGWRRAASLAAERKLPMSSHLFPETSAHLLAVTPTRHFLEYVDWAEEILAEPLQIVRGEAVIPERPGTGVACDEKAVKRYEMA